MADTIFTRALAQAAQIHGSTQAVASLLRVPENTLLRWMQGRAMMPVRAFTMLMDLLKGVDTHPIDAAHSTPEGIFKFSHGEQAAFCAACKSTQFMSTTPSSTLRYRSTLKCIACPQEVVLADLLAQFAEHHGRASRRKTVAADRATLR